jgi:hypothetical protein
MNEGQWEVIAPTYDAVSHALFFKGFLHFSRSSVTRVCNTRFAVTHCFGYQWKACGVSAEVDTPAFKQIEVANCVGRSLGDNILVTKEGSVSNCIFSMAAVIGFLYRCSETVASCICTAPQCVDCDHER